MGSGTAFGIATRKLDERMSVIEAEGELDLSGAPNLKWVLLDALESASKTVMLDLSLLTFIDSTALGVLVSVNRRLAHGRLAIACPHEKVRRIFELSGIDGVLPLFDSAAEALAFLRRSTERAA